MKRWNNCHLELPQPTALTQSRQAISETVFTANHLTDTDKQIVQEIYKLNTTQKSTQHKNTAEQNYPGAVDSYDTWPGNETGLFYNAPEPRRGERISQLRLAISAFQRVHWTVHAGDVHAVEVDCVGNGQSNKWLSV